MRTLLRHGANPFGASAEQKAERRWDAWPNQDYKFPYPIESLMVQTFKAFDEAGWGRCIWDHHISLLHEEHDDMEHEVEVRDSVLPMPSLLAKSRVPRAQVFFSKQRCYEVSNLSERRFLLVLATSRAQAFFLRQNTNLEASESLTNHTQNGDY